MDIILQGLREQYPGGHPNFIPLCLKEIALHASKNKDYTGGGALDPLGNFHRVSKTLIEWGLNITPSLVAFIYMLKQVDAAGNMLGRGYEGSVEGMAGRLQDISVYAKLVQILYEEEPWHEEQTTP